MKRILSSAAFAAVLPFAAFAQDEHAQLRESVAASAVVQQAQINVDTLTDRQVSEIFAIINDSATSDEDKLQKVQEVVGM